MIKGCSRRIYHVRNVSGKFFEEAYFVLKDGAVRKDMPAATLAEEADRLIREVSSTFVSSKTDRRHSFSRLTAFLAGVASSSAIMGIIALLIAL